MFSMIGGSRHVEMNWKQYCIIITIVIKVLNELFHCPPREEN